MENLAFMTANEVRASVQRGNAAAAALRTGTDSGFRYRDACIVAAKRYGVPYAARLALDYTGNGRLTIDDATKWVIEQLRRHRKELLEKIAAEN